MAKIVRYNGNLQAFASAAIGTERTLFGEVTQADDLTSQFTADFFRGWGIVGPSDQPTLEDFNAAMYTNGQLSAYLHQIGIAEYNAAQEYHIGSLCNVAGVVYSSLINTNVGNTPASSPAQWRELYAPATETLRGSVELATAAETIAGVSQALATHPLGVAAAITAAISASVKLPAGYIFGFKLSNNSGAPNTTLDVAAGFARSTDNTVDVTLSAGLSGILQAAGVWTAGNNQNKLDTGAKAVSTWYHTYSIRKTSDGTGDILFSLSASAPTMPSGYSGFRRIGSIRTDASGNIVAFSQLGDRFLLKTPILDVNNVTWPTGSRTLYTLTVPTGVQVLAMTNITFGTVSSVESIYVTSPDVNDLAPSITLAPLATSRAILGASTTGANQFYNETRVNTSSQIGVRSTNGTINGYIATVGWVDDRGRNS